MKFGLLSVVAASAVLIVTTSTATADSAQKPEDFPNRPINFVVPYPPGGGVDLTARTLATQMERVTGYQFRVENRAGGGSVIGNTYVAKQAKPDGYTVDVLSNPTMAISIAGASAPFAKEDLVPIAGITFAPVLWLSRTDSKIGDMDFKQVVEYAKAHPGELKVGVIPNGAFDIATRIVAKQLGADFSIVPFQGGKPAAVALLGGNLDIAANYYDEVAQYIDSGDLKPLAISNNEPLSQLPDVITMKDVGVKMQPDTWGADRFVAINSKVPDDIKAFLTSLIEETLKDPETEEAFAKVGIELMPKTAEQEQQFYDDSYEAVKEYFKDAQP
ncbi:Bug family tripartite tricarboxylate transporter substrate binding protein [Consotaella aegiceratis]|uniref:Bug family tripartite tricarboxylate transporter substrate binding protein n=1 Tax=Consotaella aegiceratis TaxID=3097961 RepID=UPI002F418E8D